MNNRQYWEERQSLNYISGEKEIVSFYKELEKAFIQAKREIESVINDFYIRYADNNGVSYAKAQKLLEKQEIGELKDYIKQVYASMGTRDVNVINKSIKSRITRYEALEKQIQSILDNLYDIQYKDSGINKLKEVYENSYYNTWYNIDVYNGFHKEFAQVDVRTIEELIKYPFNGASYSDRIWKQKEHMITKLKENITTMLVQGKNPKTLSADFAKIFKTKEFEAYRLLHTESSFIIEQGTLAAYKEDGVKEYQILATLDMKTSDICREQDSKVYEIDKYVTGDTAPPFHQFCRTTTVPYYGEDEGTRVARNPLSNKKMEVPASMSYNEWHNKYVKNNPEASLEKKKQNNRNIDKKQYEKYKEVLEKESPKSLKEFQELKYNGSEKWDNLKAQYKKLNYYNKVIKNEPNITLDLKDIANKTGSELVGLDFRLKSKESYLRKVNTDSKNSLELDIIKNVIEDTNDIIRYTYQSSYKDLVDKYFEIDKALASKGYNQIKLKNTWLIKSNPYKGINCNYAAPNGQKFEIQYHTPESFELKNGELHSLYEKWRIIENKASKEAIELSKRMSELSSKLKYPDNIEKVR